MKKIFLILIVSALLLTFQDQAQAATGLCYGSDFKVVNIEEAECKQKASIGFRWVTPPGICIGANGKAAAIPEAECKQKASIGFRWLPGVPSSSTTTGTPPSPPSTTPARNTSYKLLAPLPTPGGPLTNYEVGAENQLSKYLNTALQIFIGICAVLATIMIVIGGLEYMTSELVSSKESGISKINQAIMGLLLALGAWIILNQINPDLLQTDFENSKEFQAEVLFIEGPTVTLSGAAADAICNKKDPATGATSCNESELVSVPLMGFTVRVNKAIEQNIKNVDAAWKASTDPKVKNYKIRQMGSYNRRSAINSTPPVPSAHSFGLAIDINGNTNPYIDNSSPCTTDMPAAFVKLFTDQGFGWGGYWKSKKDPMHFSKMGGETGYLSGTCSGLK